MKTWVQLLGQENPLEEETATYCRILACKIPWTEEPGGPQSMGSQRVRPKLNDVSMHTCPTHKGQRKQIKQRGEKKEALKIKNTTPKDNRFKGVFQ